MLGYIRCSCTYTSYHTPQLHCHLHTTHSTRHLHINSTITNSMSHQHIHFVMSHGGVWLLYDWIVRVDDGYIYIYICTMKIYVRITAKTYLCIDVNSITEDCLRTHFKHADPSDFLTLCLTMSLSAPWTQQLLLFELCLCRKPTAKKRQCCFSHESVQEQRQQWKRSADSTSLVVNSNHNTVTRTHTCTCTRTHTHTHTHTYAHTHTPTHTYAHTHLRTHTYPHTHIHTHIHTHKIIYSLTLSGQL